MNITDITLDQENLVILGLRGEDENGEHELIIRDAIFENGCPLPGDSAFIYYIEGKNDSLIVLRIKML